MSRRRKALLDDWRSWIIVVEILAVLVGLSRPASAAVAEVTRFRPESVVEAVRRTWPRTRAPMVRSGLTSDAPPAWPRSIPPGRGGYRKLAPSSNELTAALKGRSDGLLIDRKGIEHTLADLGVKAHAARRGPAVLLMRGRNIEPQRQIDEAVFPLFQKIEYRNDIVESVNGLRRVGMLDGHKQLAEHLRKSYGRKRKDARMLAASFDPGAVVYEYQVETDDLQLLRLYGGSSGKKGKWFFCCLERANAQGTALPISNTMERMATVTIPSGTRVLVGVVADQQDPTMRPNGGNTQFFIPDGLPVPDSAYSDYEIARAEHPEGPGDVVVARDDGRTVRFRPVRQDGPSERVKAAVPKMQSLVLPSASKPPKTAGE